MFKELAPILKNCTSINVILASNKDGTLSVTILPKPKETGESAVALSTPLSLTATPEELDAEFTQILTGYAVTHQSLAEQVENTTEILEAAKKESQKKATTAISKASTKSSTENSGSSGDDIDEDQDVDSGNAGNANASQTTEVPAQAENLWG